MSFAFDFDTEGHKSPLNVSTLSRPTGSSKGQLYHLTANERRLVNQISQECQRLLDINGLSTFQQVQTLHSGISGMEAVIAKDWNALAESAQRGIQACDHVEIVSPYIFQHRDSANRNLASPMRAGLKDIALRLYVMDPGPAQSIIDTAQCLSAMACAALSAERGLIHLAKENFGSVIRTLGQPGSPHRPFINWTSELQNLATRFSRSTVKMP